MIFKEEAKWNWETSIDKKLEIHFNFLLFMNIKSSHQYGFVRHNLSLRVCLYFKYSCKSKEFSACGVINTWPSLLQSG